jgi:hypothetical protein
MSLRHRESLTPERISAEYFSRDGGFRVDSRLTGRVLKYRLEGEDNEDTITNYDYSALFVYLIRVRYKVSIYEGFDFRLASVARSAT